MKIDKIIFAVNDSPKYKGFWKINSEICKKILGITPVLFYITDEDSDFFEDEYGLVKKVKKLPNYNSAFQSQVYRMYGTKYFPNEVCIISDIDMLIVNKSYILDQVKDFDNEDFVIYISDAYDNKREECVGIYSEPRIPMCYNAAKGKTFNDILNTFRSFDQFLNEVTSVCESEHDRDEIFLGKKIQSYYNQNKIKKLIRGYETPFVCHKRNDRPLNENFFNNYNKEDMSNGKIIDIHLSRPYFKHEKEIDELKKVILGELREIYVIGCHIENDLQLTMVKNLVDDLYKNNKDFIISSHTMVPQELISKSKGFIYDSENPKYKIWNLPNKNKYTIDLESFTIISPYVSYGRVDYYHVGPLRQIINGINLVKTMNYDVIHWMDYDATLDLDESKKNLERLKKYDMVFYGVGPKFSFKVNKVRDDLFNMKNENLLSLLSKHDYVIEKVFGSYLINGEVLFIEVTDPSFWGKYSQNFDEIKFDWSFFELGEDVNLFIKNDDQKKIIFKLKINNVERIFISESNTWFWTSVGKSNEIRETYLEWETSNSNKNILLDLNMMDGDNYKNIIKSVEYTVR